MKVLVLNAGSSTLKYLLMDMTSKDTLAKGVVDRIGISGSYIEYRKGDFKLKTEHKIADHGDAMDLVLEALTNSEHGVLSDISEITVFGHRFVHAGTKIFNPTLITEEVLKELEASVDLAPLHIPGSTTGVKACMKIAPQIPNVMVVDTGFHSQMPEHAFRYAIPKNDYTELGIRRYGFHGTSHYFVTHALAEIENKPVEDLKIITCHLGNGSSVSAVKNAHSIDTSMGFTPLEGMVMGTRSGDIDPAVIGYLAEKRNMTAQEVVTYLNKQSGLLGISGISGDMRDIESNLDNADAQLALDMLIYRLKKYIGSYLAVLNGADAIVFTGGIGENDELVRAGALKNMEYAGVKLDLDLNHANIRGIARKISTEDSKVAVYIIPTNEELVIAEEALKLALSK